MFQKVKLGYQSPLKKSTNKDGRLVERKACLFFLKNLAKPLKNSPRVAAKEHHFNMYFKLALS